MSLFFDDEVELNEEGEEIIVGEDGRYSTKVAIPQYNPSTYCPSFSEIMDTTKYEDLVKEINESNISDDEKRFLRLCASRHIVFNFSKVADYYVNSRKEIQQLLEKSAMVVIDINDALANGYLKVDYRLTEIAEAARASNNSEDTEVE